MVNDACGSYKREFSIMKLHECYTCHRYVEEIDTEKIDGFFYCYACFNYCYECERPYPVTEDDNHTCSKCKLKEE